jgi:hypothetical protein
MSFTTLFMILAFAAGSGPSQPSDTTSSCPSTMRNCKIASNCYINGVWYNPCPGDEDWDPEPEPDPSPETLIPY